MTRIANAIKNVFPGCDKSNVSAAMTLGEIPGWDSMNSVNLTLELENTFAVDLSNVILSSENTAGDIAEIIRGRGVMVDSE